MEPELEATLNRFVVAVPPLPEVALVSRGVRHGFGIKSGRTMHFRPGGDIEVQATESTGTIRREKEGVAVGSDRRLLFRPGAVHGGAQIDFALKTSLQVLEPHQMALRALTPVMVGDPEEGIFSPGTAFSRLRVQRVFEQAVIESSDAPKPPLAEALGRLLYLVHLAVLLWWLLDKSPNQRATARLVLLTQQLLPSAGVALRVPPVRKFVISVDELVREALFGSPVSA